MRLLAQSAVKLGVGSRTVRDGAETWLGEQQNDTLQRGPRTELGSSGSSASPEVEQRDCFGPQRWGEDKRSLREIVVGVVVGVGT